MSNANLSLRVHYLNVQPSEALSAAIEQGSALLAPHRARIAHCELHVGRWVQHHDLGTSFRVALEVEPERGTAPVSIECESGPSPLLPELLPLVNQVFRRTAARLAARAQYAAEQASSPLSPEARRLHPLHGLAPEELSYDADD